MSHPFVQVVPFGVRTLFETSNKTCQAEFLLAPDPLMVAMCIGLVEWARRCNPGVQIHSFSFQSNHYHMLLSVTEGDQLARFMMMLNSELARAINLHRRRFGRVWEDTYWRGEVAPEAEHERAIHCAGQGLAEGLYERALQNPCAHTLQALCNGRTLAGLLPNVRAWTAARRKDPEVGPAAFVQPIQLTLSPLPHLAHLSVSQQRHAWNTIVAEANERGRLAREKKNRIILGAEAMRRMDPFHRPTRTKRGSKPILCLGSNASQQAVKTRNHATLERRAEHYEQLAEYAIKLGLPSDVFPPSSLLPFLRRLKKGSALHST